MKIDIIRNKNVFCKFVNMKKKHRLVVYKPNTRIFFKFKFTKIIIPSVIELIDLERILDCLNELDLIVRGIK